MALDLQQVAALREQRSPAEHNRSFLLKWVTRHAYPTGSEICSAVKILKPILLVLVGMVIGGAIGAGGPLQTQSASNETAAPAAPPGD